MGRVARQTCTVQLQYALGAFSNSGLSATLNPGSNSNRAKLKGW